MAYLDNTGLAYFWGKIKAYIAALLAPKANDADVVHKTGDETVSGLKSFVQPSVVLQHPSAEVGVNPSANQYLEIFLADKNYDPATSADPGRAPETSPAPTRFGEIQWCRRPSGLDSLEFTLRKLDPEDSTKTIGDNIGIAYDTTNGFYAYCPSTSNQRNTGNDILTRDWIPKDTRIVHTTGDETISGRKKFDNILLDLDHSSRRAGGVNVILRKEAGDVTNTDAMFSFIYNTPSGKIVGYSRERFLPNGETYFEFVTADISDKDNITSYGLVLESGWSGDSPCFRPTSTNTINLGRAVYRYKEIFCANATINTSDERLKSTITSIPDDVLDAWSNIEFVQYQFNDALRKKGSSARLHNGLIAQNIDKVFNAANLDASRYGLFCYDEWDAQPEEFDEAGNKVREAQPAGNQYSLRYEEALCMEAAYQRRRADRAEARIAALEERLAALELRLGSA